MKKQLSPTEQAVDAWLLEKQIKFTVSGGMAMKDENDWEHDLWQYMLWRPSGEARNGKTISDSYKTGTGHRVLTARGKLELSHYYQKASYHVRERVKAQNSVAVAPHAAGILHCIISDASGAEQNFHDWCGDYGYDNDSIKSQNIYNACCEVLAKVRMFFTGAEREELQKLLEDY